MDQPTPFLDRRDAGQRLAARLRQVPFEHPIVFALPRGGVPVAAEVASALKAPLDLLLVRKIGAPNQSELAVGAIIDGKSPEVVINREVAAATGADDSYIAAAQAHELREIERRRAVYLGKRQAIDPAGRDAIIVDDGLATGASALAAVHALNRRGARRVVVAVPVAPPETVRRLQREADLVLCLVQPAWFGSVADFYDDFHQLADAEVTALMNVTNADEAAASVKNAG